MLSVQVPGSVFGVHALHGCTRASRDRGNVSGIVAGCRGEQGRNNQLCVYDIRTVGRPAAPLVAVAQHNLPDGCPEMDASGNMVAVLSSMFVEHRYRLQLQWWDMQQQGGAGLRLGDVDCMDNFGPLRVSLSDDGRMAFVNNDVGHVRSWCLDGRTWEQPLVVEGVNSVAVAYCTCIDAADTLVVFGSESKSVCFVDYGAVDGEWGIE